MSADAYLDAVLELGGALREAFAPPWERAHLDGAGDALSADDVWAPLDEPWREFLGGVARLPFSRAVLLSELGMEVARPRYAEMRAWLARWAAPLRRAWERQEGLAEAADELRAMAARIERYFEWMAAHRRFVERFLLR